MVDMGDADPDKAYSALKTILDGFNSASQDVFGWVQIKSLVAGE